MSSRLTFTPATRPFLRPKLCKDCAHFVRTPTSDAANGTCELFGKICLVTGERDLMIAGIVREYESCGIEGAHHEPRRGPFDWLLLE